MKIVVAPPPIIDEIVAVFSNARNPGVLFAFGDTIYNPDGLFIPPALIAHEEAHGARQRNYTSFGCRCIGCTKSVECWWNYYLKDPEFRYREEVIAHAAEFLAQDTRDRNMRAKLLMSTAQRLTAPLYAYGSKQPALSVALRDLRWEIERT